MNVGVMTLCLESNNVGNEGILAILNGLAHNQYLVELRADNSESFLLCFI